MDFINDAKNIHGNKYDYSKVDYKNKATKVCIICSKHGEFWQTPKNHLNGANCPKCANELRGKNRRMTKEEFIRRAREVHGWKYDYSKVEYVNYEKKVCIICSKHGEFWQTPHSHLDGQCCPKCSGRYMTKEYFIEKSNKIHDNKYDYSKVEYNGVHKKVCIICPKHGEFWQSPHCHLDGFGCRICSNTFMNSDLFTEKAREKHGDKYDYSKVEYVNNHTKVCIICPEHGEFWQVPNSHLNGRGCPFCKESHLERDMKKILDVTQMPYKYQYRNKELLNKQSLDFYLPEYKIAIECQGEQHFIANFYKSKGVEFAEEHLRYIQGLDERKRQICKENDIILIYYLDKKFNKYIGNNMPRCNTEEELLKIIDEIKKEKDGATSTKDN